MIFKSKMGRDHSAEHALPQTLPEPQTSNLPGIALTVRKKIIEFVGL